MFFFAPPEYYIAPFIAAITGALLGAASRDRFTKLAYGALCLAIVAITAAFEFRWLASRAGATLEGRLVLATFLTLLVPAGASFAMAVTTRSLSRLGRLVTIFLIVAAVVALYPVYALILFCYVGHDCI